MTVLTSLKALSELVTSCTYRTKGSSCEDMVRKCLLCTKHPEKCVKIRRATTRGKKREQINMNNWQRNIKTAH